MKHNTLYTEKAPAPIGPYSQGTAFGSMVFVSGQIALNPETGDFENQSIEAETHRVMKNLIAVLAAGGATLEHVVKCTIFVTDLNNFALINQIYGSYFSQNKPARETVEVSRLPKDAQVEISAIACI